MNRFVVVLTLAGISLAATAEPVTPRDTLLAEATRLSEMIESEPARRFLRAAPSLPSIEPRTVYRHPETRDASPDSLPDYEPFTADERFYYYTRYGSPLAFVRPLDILGAAGLDELDDAKIADFGFGSIGHLRLLAQCGADVHGIEVDPLLRAVYSAPIDVGRIGGGSLALHFGRFPAEPRIVDSVGERYDAFISKNTLKNGYIHPAEEVDPRMLVDLGVDDRTFVRAVHRLLVRGGFFLIYNLSPPQSEERYLPWADGRSPFSAELLVSLGFEVLAFDEDDTEAAKALGAHLGWGESMDLENGLFGSYMLARKR